MADQFQNPKDQANLNRLAAKLAAIVGELGDEAKAIEEQIEVQSQATREAIEAEASLARISGGIRNSLAGVEEIKAATGALDEYAAAMQRILLANRELNVLQERTLAIAKESAGALEATGVGEAKTRYSAAVGAQAGAEAARYEAGAAYTTASRDPEAEQQLRADLLERKLQADRQVVLARSETAAAQKDLEAAEAAAQAREQYALAAEAEQVQQQKLSAQNAAAVRDALRAESFQKFGALTQRSPLLLGPGSPEESRRSAIPLGGIGSTSTNAAEEAEQVQATATAAAAAEARLGDSFALASSQEARAIVQMRTHGALTTDFVNQLIRGNVTLSQFGNELKTTIGKFAGWAGAAALTYGALDAVKQIGEGAIQSSSGAQQLKRTVDDLDTTKAQAQFRELSQSTNVSIGQAADAVFQFSRTFHDQTSAVEAARQGLNAYQLDNVQLSDSVKAATVLHQQFGVSAHGLAGVFNVLSSAQREYNARLSDMIPLVQKAGGAFKNAGGTLPELLQQGAFFTRVTQLSGSQIGTALYRAASNFTNPSTTKGAADLQALQSLGINVTGGIGSIIEQAIRRAPELSGYNRARLANSIFGPQYGGRVAAAFSGRQDTAQLFNQITSGRHALTEADTRGATNTELTRQLGRTDEQIKAIGNSLERLGSSLASSGLFAPLHAGLEVIHELTDSFGGLVTTLTSLPKVVRDVIEGFVAFRGAAAFLTRTRLGQSIGQLPGLRQVTNVVPGLKPSDAQVLRGNVADAAKVRADLYADALNSTGNDFERIRVEIGKLVAANERIDTELNAAVDGSEEQLRLEAEYAANKEELAELERKAAAAQTELVDLTNLQKSANADYVAATAIGRKRASDTQIAAMAPVYGATADSEITADQSATFSAVAGAKIKRQVAAAQQRLSAAFAGEADATDAVATGEREVAATAEEASAAALASVPLTEAATTSLVALRTGVMEFAASIDPMLAAILILPLAYHELSKVANKANAALKQNTAAAQQPITDLDSLKQYVAANQRAANHPGTLSFQHVTGVGRAITDIPIVGGVARNEASFFSGLIGQTNDVSQNRQNAITGAKAEAAYSKYLKAAQGDAKQFSQLKEGRTKFQQYLNLYTLQLDNAVNDLPQGITIENAFSKQIAELRKRTESVQSVIKVDKNNPLAQFSTISPTVLETDLTSSSDYSKVYGGLNRSQISKATATLAALTTRLRSDHATQDLAALSTAQSNYSDAVLKGANDLLTKAGTASSASGSLQASNEAIASINQGQQVINNLLNEIKKKYGADSKVFEAAEKSFAQVDQQFNALRDSAIQAAVQAQQSMNSVLVSRNMGISPGADIQRQVTALYGPGGAQAQLQLARRDHAPSQEIDQLLATANNDRAALIKARVDDARNLAQALGQESQASIFGASPEAQIAQARRAVQTDQRILSMDQASHAGRTQIAQDYAQLYGDENTLLNDIRSNAKAISDAYYALQEAGTLNPVTQTQDQIKAAISDLQKDIAANAGAAQIEQDRATLKGLYEQQAQNREAITLSRYDIAASSTQDPVKQLDAQVAQARKQLEEDKKLGKGQQQINEDIANLRNLQNQRVQAVTQQKQEEIEYLAATYQINPTEEAARLQKLLDQAKKMHEPITVLHSLAEEIYNLTHGDSSSLSLNLGNLQVPSTYQVRAAIAKATRSRGRAATREALANINQNNRINIIVRKDADIKKVADAVGDALNANVTAAAKASGLI